MENVEMKRVGNKLTITIDLSNKGVPSTTGKTTVIASTKGNAPITEEKTDTGPMFLGLNVFMKPKK